MTLRTETGQQGKEGHTDLGTHIEIETSQRQSRLEKERIERKKV